MLRGRAKILVSTWIEAAISAEREVDSKSDTR